MQFTINYFQKQSPGGVVLKSFTKFKKKTPVNFAKFLKTPFFTEYLCWLLLYFMRKSFFSSLFVILAEDRSKLRKTFELNGTAGASAMGRGSGRHAYPLSNSIPQFYLQSFTAFPILTFSLNYFCYYCCDFLK